MSAGARSGRVRAAAAALARDLEPLEDECERAGGRLAPARLEAIRERIRESGLAAGGIPERFGGGGFTLSEQIAVAEELGGLTNALWALVPAPGKVLLHGTPEQLERYLLPAVRGERTDAFAVTEEHAGSDPRAIRAVAVRDGDGYRLSGAKWFVTGGDVADFLVVLAWAVDGDERLPTLFLVDRAAGGVEVEEDPDFTNAAVTRHPTVRFHDTPLAADSVLGERGRGFRLAGEWFVEERALVAARCVGACRRLLALGTDHALAREQFAARIFDHQAIAFALADSVAETASARLLVERVGRLHDDGADPRLVHAAASLAKLVASETAGRVADRVVQVLGGRGTMRRNAAERLWRQVRVDRIWVGTSEIHRLVLARALERRGPDALLDLLAGEPPAAPDV